MRANPKCQEGQGYKVNLMLEQMCCTQSHNCSSSGFNGASGAQQ